MKKHLRFHIMLWAAVWLSSAAAPMISPPALAQGVTGFNLSFDGSPASPDLWLNSCGTEAILVNWWPDAGGYVLMSVFNMNTGEGQDAARNSNVKFPNIGWGEMDNITGMVWGPVFTVLDGQAEIIVELAGGSPVSAIGASPQSTKRAAGVALWDIESGEFIPDSFRWRPNQNGSASVTIPLQYGSLDLTGKQIMLVGLDREAGHFGWFGIQSVSAPEGSVKLWDADKMHRVLKEWTFDDGWQGWYEVDHNEDLRTGGGIQIAGNPVNFMLGDNSLGSLYYYIDSQGFGPGKGYVGAYFNDHWENAYGVLRSPTFTLEGDVIEFMIGGWQGDNPNVVAPINKPAGFRGDELYNVGFDLMIQGLDLDHPELFILAMSSTSYVNMNDFVYDFWSIKEFEGMEAYLRLRDYSVAEGYAWIAVDNIRMLDFAVMEENGAPEPGTWGMLLFGILCGGIGIRRYRRQPSPSRRQGCVE